MAGERELHAVGLLRLARQSRVRPARWARRRHVEPDCVRVDARHWRRLRTREHRSASSRDVQWHLGAWLRLPVERAVLLRVGPALRNELGWRPAPTWNDRRPGLLGQGSAAYGWRTRSSQ